MLRIDGFYLYTLGHSIHPLENIQPGDGYENWVFPLLVAQDAVIGFVNSDVYEPRVSHSVGIKLLNILNRLLSNQERTEPITPYERYQISTALSEFEHVLAAEFGQMNIWLVRRKRGYDTNALISEGWSLFPPDLSTKVPEAIPDVVSATQCIAFTLATAAAFHLHRANESVLHRYYDAVTGGNPRPANRNMGDYLAEMRDRYKVGDPKVLSALKDLKDLHRNPLIHPEESLESIDEAIALLGAVQATIAPMLKAIPGPEPKVEPPELTEAATL